MGTETAVDKLIYFGKDDTYDVAVGEKSKKYILISSSSTLTSEFRTFIIDSQKVTLTVFRKEDYTVFRITETVLYCYQQR
jgi:oligopeptidase B